MTTSDSPDQQSADAMSSGAPGSDPMSVLQAWYAEARDAGDPVPDAMTLATATLDGQPSARIVLFKGVLRGGVMFVSNYQSRKARELEQNPRAALVMHQVLRERQVRLEGRVERASAAESDAYFASRPLGSQLGAWASPQSRPVGSRAELEARVQEAAQRFSGTTPTRPPFWGGYLLFPELVELWLGRPDRLHDRFQYRRGESAWQVQRLAP